MAREISPKCKKCRRAAEKLFLKGERCATPKCAIVRRPFPPGVHGKKPHRAKSEYGKQLEMKQKIKRIYGIMERQLRKYFEDVRKKPGIIGDLLMAKLETRFDSVVYRAGFSSNRSDARQRIRHSAFLVNGKTMNIPSYEVKVGDKITVKEQKKKKTYFLSLAEKLAAQKDQLTHASWLEVDPRNLAVEMKTKPGREETASGIDIQMVIEYYSR